MKFRAPVTLALAVGLVVLGATTAARSCAAQANFVGHGDHDHVKFAAPGLVLDHASHDWANVARLADPQQADDPWAAFATVMGPGWIVNHDSAFGTPSWIQGPGLATGIVPLNEDAALDHAHKLAGRLAAALGIDDLRGMRVSEVSTTPNQHQHLICGVNFKQTIDGYDVRTLKGPRRVIFRYDLTLGRLSVVGSDWLAGLEVETTGATSRDMALQQARSMVPAYAPGTGRILHFRTFVLVGAEEDSAKPQARLVHEVQIQVDDPAHLWIVILDAHTGERLYLADGVCHTDVTGSVSLGGLDGSGGTPPAVPFSVKPAQNLYISLVGGGTATTDLNGVFKIPNGGTTAVTLQGRLAGDWCTVQTKLGSNVSFSQPATPGTPANIVINGTHTSEYVTAEATAYDWVTRTHHFIKKRWPAWGTGTHAYLAKLTTNVNIGSTCNAYWNGSSINFYRYGGGCNNTAIPEVISHEWGHGFHYTWNNRSTSPGGFSEGIGDHMGLYITRQRIMGRGFRTTGGVVRDYRVGGAANLTTWPAAGKQVHLAGQIWGGFVMDLRDYLMTKHGATQGEDIAETITIAQYARVPSDMDDGVRETMVQDDNDANLLNGSPNFTEIAKAADRHLIPRPPDPLIVQFTHTPLTTTRDVVNAYPVSAKILSTVATITSARLFYWVGSSSPVSVAMIKGANDTYSAAIPAQSAVNTVSYYLTATDSLTNTASMPSNGAYLFEVGHEVLAFREDFEQPKAWTRGTTDTATRGRWEIADPIYAAYSGTGQNQPEDDTTPAPGVQCAVTENGLRGQTGNVHDVDGGYTTFWSPAFDMTAVPAGTATVDFSYWFANYIRNDDAVRLEVSSNNGSTWSTVWSTSVSSASWKSAKGVPLGGSYTDKMRLKFVTYDTGTGSQTDALFDDIVIRAMDDNVAALRAQTGKPAPGTTLNYTLDARKEPNAVFVYVVGFALGQTQIPGIGTCDLQLPFHPLWTATTDAAGSATFKIPLPNVPALKGIKAYSQSLVAGKAYIFSNVWTVEIQ